MEKQDNGTAPFSARVSQEFKQELQWLASHWKCSMRSAMEQAVEQAYQRQRTYTLALHIGAQELEREQEQEREEQFV